MMTEEQMIMKQGFLKVKEKGYTKKLGHLDILLEKRSGVWEIKVPCASSYIDYEQELDEYLKQEIRSCPCLEGSFEVRLLQLRLTARELTEELLESALKIPEKMLEKFDLLPVCMRCGKVMPVTVTETENRVQTICGVCSDVLKLEEKQKKVREKYQKESEKEYVAKVIQKRPVCSSMKAGLHGGVIASAIGGILLILTVMHSMFVLMLLFIPGAVAGARTMSDLKKIDHLRSFTKIMLGFFSFMVTILILSFANFELFSLISSGVLKAPGSFKLGSVLQYNLVMGLGSYCLSQICVSFLKD